MSALRWEVVQEDGAASWVAQVPDCPGYCLRICQRPTEDGGIEYYEDSSMDMMMSDEPASWSKLDDALAELEQHYKDL